MAKIKLLTARQVDTLPAGFHSDGSNLYLRVRESLARSWVFRYKTGGKVIEIGLGPVADRSLAQARGVAAKMRTALAEGNDPGALVRATRDTTADKVEEAKRALFEDAAKSYIRDNRAGWKNAKHAQQWENTLKTYAFPVIGDLPCEAVDVALVKKILVPIWTTKTETASRVRSRIELVLRAWAAEHGLDSYNNPARLERLSLPKRNKVQKAKHHPALPFADIGGFMNALRAMKGTAARALELAILTACRTNEIIGMRWPEIDLKGNVWTIPAGRMKAEKEHRIPLSTRAREILMAQQKVRIDDVEYVFIGDKPGLPLSNMAMLALIQRMNEGDGGPRWVDPKQVNRPVVPHGFRSTFRDWAGEKTNFPREVVEHAMAHQLPDEAEAAYARGTMFDKRRKLMQTWATYCETETGKSKVIQIASAA